MAVDTSYFCGSRGFKAGDAAGGFQEGLDLIRVEDRGEVRAKGAGDDDLGYGDANYAAENADLGYGAHCYGW